MGDDLYVHQVFQVFHIYHPHTDIYKYRLDQRTPLHSAMENHHKEVVNLFIEKGADTASRKVPALTGRYMGQKQPCLRPEIFSPGIVSTDKDEFGITFSPDGKELYFTRGVDVHIGKNIYNINTIMVAKLINNKWTEPEAAFPTDQYFDFEPHISPDGKRLYFGSNRPLLGEKQSTGLHQWVLEKTDTGWSEPKPLGSPFVDIFVMNISSTKEGPP